MNVKHAILLLPYVNVRMLIMKNVLIYMYINSLLTHAHCWQCVQVVCELRVLVVTIITCSQPVHLHHTITESNEEEERGGVRLGRVGREVEASDAASER